MIWHRQLTGPPTHAYITSRVSRWSISDIRCRGPRVFSVRTTELLYGYGVIYRFVNLWSLLSMYVDTETEYVVTTWVRNVCELWYHRSPLNSENALGLYSQFSEMTRAMSRAAAFAVPQPLQHHWDTHMIPRFMIVTSMHHFFHIHHHQLLLYNDSQHSSGHWGFWMMSLENMNESGVEKTQNSFGESLKVEVAHWFHALAIMLTTWLPVGSGHASFPLRNPRQTKCTNNPAKETHQLPPYPWINTVKRHETQLLNCTRSLSWSVDTVSKTKRRTTKIDRVFAFASKAEKALPLWANALFLDSVSARTGANTGCFSDWT